MLDIFDFIAFLAMAATVVLVVVIVVSLGQLPGQIARRRGHPQADAINVASWLGVATMGLLWPIAFVWAFIHPFKTSAIDAEPRPTANRTSDA